MLARETLCGRGIFAAVPEARLDPFAQIGEVVEVPAGEFLFRFGDRAKWLYVIERGKVDLAIPLLIHGAPKDVTIQTAVAGETLAWSALVPPHMLTMSARVVESCRLSRFAGDALAALCRQEAAVGLAVFERLAEVVGRRLQQVQAMWLRELQRSIDVRHA